MIKSEFYKKYKYDGELGAVYTKQSTKFILWAPIALSVDLLLEDKIYKMKRGDKGQWTVVVEGDLDSKFYNYIVDGDDVVDPYAKAVSVNGTRAMVVDLNSTNPKKWDEDKKPCLEKITDSILYEMHVRDFSIDENSGVSKEHRGKFLGVIEGKPIEHLKELGITHVHLMPSFDYETIDESKSLENQYNWGYDPQNYNVPEGSYSTNAFDGKTRIREFKEMILGLHKAGIRVVMDMVYNHTFRAQDSSLNKAVPGYYYRTYEDGSFSNGSGCGNETASERNMVRRLIVDSVLYYAKEYHIDGFRFDLMAVHDIDTMITIRKKLDEIDKSIIMYGEGWNGGTSLLNPEEAAFKANTYKFEKRQIACFSDDVRDALKGRVFERDSRGFINGKEGLEESIKAAAVAFTNHPDIKYEDVMYLGKPWADEPYQTVIYESAHDNFTLWDKINLAKDDSDSKEDLIKMNNLAASIVLLSQGISFLHSGEEFLRTKRDENNNLIEDSYNSLDRVNKIYWNRKEKYIDVFNYYKGLIEVRKKYKEFRMESSEEINEKIKFFNDVPSNVVAFSINKNIVVIHNSNRKSIEVDLKECGWSLIVDGVKAGTEELRSIEGSKVKVSPIATYVLIKK
ncbi:MAG: type I pullulanase [Clostridium sp.]|nr:type I pullulanase [Clostridium sp.]